MKAKFSFLILSILILPSLNFSQIVIDKDDLIFLNDPGFEFSLHIDFDDTSLNIGELGETAWDFSNLKISEETNFDLMLPEETPFGDQYPGATTVIHQLATEKGNELWSYNSYNDDEFVYYGESFTSSKKREAVGSVKYIPPQTRILFPATYGDNWSYYGNEIMSFIDGDDSFVDTTYTKFEFSIDSYGDLTLPGKGTASAIRLFSHLTYYFDNDSVSTAEIWWVSDQGDLVIVYPAFGYADQRTGEIQVGSISWAAGQLTEVTEEEIFPDKIVLRQNYPNPFNPTTKIDYSIPESGFIEMKVYDVLGNEIATLASGFKQAGKYSAEFNGAGLASGTYLVRLTSGKTSETVKMSLIK